MDLKPESRGENMHACINGTLKLPKIEAFSLTLSGFYLVAQPPKWPRNLAVDGFALLTYGLYPSLVLFPPSNLFREGLEAITVPRALARCTMRSVPQYRTAATCQSGMGADVAALRALAPRSLIRRLGMASSPVFRSPPGRLVVGLDRLAVMVSS